MLQCAKGKDRSEIAALSIILERVFFESGSGEHGVDNGPDMEIAGIDYDNFRRDWFFSIADIQER